MSPLERASLRIPAQSTVSDYSRTGVAPKGGGERQDRGKLYNLEHRQEISLA
jgi:hypothetical protein